MEKYNNQYRIPSARAWWHSYNGGGYFVTIVTAGRLHYFGEIENAEMQLNELGRYTQKIIADTSQHNKYATIPLWIIMPNHIHLIVYINNVEKEHAPSLQIEPHISKKININMKNISQYKGKLSITIGSIKSAITHYANTHHIPFVWQARFHDRIIRDRNELNLIAEYIETNSSNWDSDEYS